jgi:hypothetical protein
MNIATMLQRLLRPSLKTRPRGGRTRETSDERSARKYWDGQVADDAERRGVTDKHP